MQDLARATGAGHHQDEMAYRKTGQWQKQLWSDDLNDENHLAMRRTGILRVRLRDSSLRELVGSIRSYSAQVTVSVSRDASTSAANSMGALFEQIQERVGELLRTRDDDEDSLELGAAKSQ